LGSIREPQGKDPEVNSSPFIPPQQNPCRRMGVTGEATLPKVLSPVISKRPSSTPPGPPGESQDPGAPFSRCMTLREVLYIVLILDLIDVFVLVSALMYYYG